MMRGRETIAGEDDFARAGNARVISEKTDKADDGGQGNGVAAEEREPGIIRPPAERLSREKRTIDKKKAETETKGKEVGGEKEKLEKGTLREKLGVSLDILKEFLTELPDGRDKERVLHTVMSIEYALKNLGKNGALSGKYTVFVEGKPGNPAGAYTQNEGVPVDEAIDILRNRAEKIVKETVERARKNLVELKKKRDKLYEKYQLAPEVTEKANFYSQYDEANKEWEKAREGEELKITKVQKQSEKFSYLADELYENSVGYFEEHYSKKHGEDPKVWTEEERNKQDLRTRHEAKLVSLDYRKTGSEDGDYKAGMEILKHRRELGLAEEVEPGAELKKGLAEETGVGAPEKGQKNTAYLIDISEIAKRMAWTKAEEQLRRKFEKSNWFMKRLKSLSENYYRLKFYQEALKEIEQDNDLRKAIEGRLAGDASAGADKSNYYRILDSVVEQYEEDLAEAGDELGEKITGNPELGTKSAELFYRHQRNKWDDLGDGFKGKTGREAVELFVRMYIAPILKDAKWAVNSKDDKIRDNEAKGELFASNFFALAEGRKEFVERELEKLKREGGPENMEAIAEHLNSIMALDFQLGLKQRDLLNNQPKGVLSMFEKAVDRFEGNKILGKVIANPFTIGVVGGVLGGTAGRKLGKAGITAGLVGTGILASFAAPMAAGGIMGGALKWFKRSKDIKYDSAQERRHETLGGRGSKILEKAGDVRYSTMKFSEAQRILEDLVSKETLDDTNKKVLAEVLARLQMERSQKVDYFILDEEEGRELGTTEVAKTDLKKVLKELAKKHNISLDVKDNLDFDRDYGLAARRALIAEVKDRNEELDKFRKREAWKAAVSGAAFGIAGGVVGQYVVNKGLGFVAEKSGWAGMAGYFHSHGTTLEKLIGRGPHSAVLEDQLAQHPWETAQVSGGRGGVEMQSAMSVHQLAPSMSPEQWKQRWGVLDVRHYDWHDEVGTRGIRNLLFEGKQQQLHLNTDKSGAVKVNVQEMLKNLKENFSNSGKPGKIFGENWDRSVDSKLRDLFPNSLKHLVANPVTTDVQVQQALDNFANSIHQNVKIRIIPTEAMNQAGDGIVVGSVDSGGNLQMPNNIRQEFFSPKGEQLCKYLEVGYEDNKGNFHTLATSVAKGEGIFPDVPEIQEAVEKAPQVAAEQIKRNDWMAPLIMPFRKIYKRPEQKASDKDAVAPPASITGGAQKATSKKPTQTSAGEGGNLPIGRAAAEAAGPELNFAQVRSSMKKVVNAAERGNDEELEESMRELQTLGREYQVANPEVPEYIELAFRNMPEEARRRVQDMNKKIAENQGVSAGPGFAVRGNFGEGGGGSAEEREPAGEEGGDREASGRKNPTDGSEPGGAQITPGTVNANTKKRNPDIYPRDIHREKFVTAANNHNIYGRKPVDAWVSLMDPSISSAKERTSLGSAERSGGINGERATAIRESLKQIKNFSDMSELNNQAAEKIFQELIPLEKDSPAVVEVVKDLQALSGGMETAYQRVLEK